MRNSRCGGGRNRGSCSPKALKGPWGLGWESLLPRPQVPRVSASDPSSRTLGAAPVRLTSPWALLPSRPLPASLPKVPASHQDPLVGGGGWGGSWELVLSERARGSHPLVLGTGLEPRWRVLFSGRIVEFCRVRVLHFSVVNHPPPPPRFFSPPCPISGFGGYRSIFFSTHPPSPVAFFFFFFAANPLASGRQYYFCVYLAHHLSGRAVRLKILA